MKKSFKKFFKEFLAISLAFAMLSSQVVIGAESPEQPVSEDFVSESHESDDLASESIKSDDLSTESHESDDVASENLRSDDLSAENLESDDLSTESFESDAFLSEEDDGNADDGSAEVSEDFGSEYDHNEEDASAFNDELTNMEHLSVGNDIPDLEDGSEGGEGVKAVEEDVPDSESVSEKIPKISAEEGADEADEGTDVLAESADDADNGANALGESADVQSEELIDSDEGALNPDEGTDELDEEFIGHETEESEDGSSQEELANQEVFANQEDLTNQEDFVNSEDSSNQEEESVREEAIIREEDITQEEAIIREEDITQEEAIIQEEDITQEEAIIQEEDITQEDAITQEKDIVQEDAITQEKDIVQEDAITQENAIVQEDVIIQEGEPVSVRDIELPDGDMLLGQYLDRLMYPMKGEDEAVLQEDRREGLSDLEKEIYDILKEGISEIADGQRESTEFSIPVSELQEQTSFTAEELGVSAIVKNGSFTEEALEAVYEKLDYDSGRIMSALILDSPYELYWFDKTEGMGSSSPSILGSSTSIGFRDDAEFSFQFSVARAYRKTSSDLLNVSTAKTGAASAAVGNAMSIVEDAAGYSDYEKLVHYRKEICGLVSYDYDATHDAANYSNPWQLIYVFDGDEDTNVVCEGYSKAFKYLCDLSEFDDDDLECFLVSGVMSGGTGAGDHMWNIVHMDDGENYFVDVTNCDEDGVGADDRLFLVGYSSGSVDSGYVISWDSYQVGNTIYSGANISYYYDGDTKELFTKKELSISSANYDPSTAKEKGKEQDDGEDSEDSGGDNEDGEDSGSDDSDGLSLKDAVITLSAKSFVYNGKARKPSVKVVYEGETLVSGTDYTLTYGDNVNAGTAYVTVRGKGDYSGTVKKSFEISKAEQTLEASLEKAAVPVSGKINIIVSGSMGKLGYKSADKDIAVVTSKGVITAKKVGEVKLTVTAGATENYKKASKTLTLKVTPQKTSSVSLANTASGVKISWKKVAGATGYYVYRNGKKAATIKKAGTLSYTDKKAKTNGAKYQYQVYAYAATGKGAASARKTIYYLTRPTLSSAKNTTGKKIRAQWKKNAKASGYELRYVLGNTKKTKTVTKNGTTKLSLTGLKKGKTYKLSIRSYKTVGKTKYYSAWSVVKSVKVKK